MTIVHIVLYLQSHSHTQTYLFLLDIAKTDDPAGSLTTAEDLAKKVRELATKDSCTNHSELANVAYCDPASHYGKVNILTHDFLFEVSVLDYLAEERSGVVCNSSDC